MQISRQTTLVLHSLTIRPDRKHFIVEDHETREFFEMPEVCVEAIRKIQKGLNLGQVEKELIYQYPNEEIDIIDFGQQLFELQLIQEIDGQPVQTKTEKREKGQFLWISPQFAKGIIPRWTVKGVVLLAIINSALFFVQPSLFPHYKDLFVFDYMSLNLLLWMVVTAITLLLHEFGHVLAARAYQLPTHLSIGHRLFFVVLETDLSHGWSLQRKDRNILYLAGMYVDQWVLFLALMGQLFMPNVFLFQLIVLDVFIRTVFQCCLYMKTDLYYVLENSTGCYNLMESGKERLARWMPFMKKEKHTQIFEGEEAVVQAYSIVYVCGVVITTIVWFFYFLPQLYVAFQDTVPYLLTWNGDSHFWDAFLFISQSTLMLSFLLFSWGRKVKQS